MKRRLLPILLSIALFLTACGPANSTAPTPDLQDSAPEEPETPAPEPELPTPDAIQPSDLSERERNWLEDIAFLRDACKEEHIDPFYLCSEEEFDFKLDQLAAEVGELSDNDIALEIVSIVAGLGDPHSIARPPQSFFDRQFPVGVRYFGNRLYLTAYQEGYEQFNPHLLHEIVAVNGVDIAYLSDIANRLSNPFNTWLGRESFWRYYFLPAFFDWAGCDYKEGYTLQILNNNGEVESVELPVISNEEYDQGTRIFAENYDKLLFRRWNCAEYIDNAWWDSAVDMPEQVGVSPVFEEYYDENGKLYEWENTVLPDVYVYQDIEDIRQGKDSVVQWVLAQ